MDAAPVAQGIEHRSPKAGVEGSNPFWGTLSYPGSATADPIHITAPQVLFHLSNRVTVVTKVKCFE